MIVLTLIAAAYVCGSEGITIDQFKARPIPAFAKKLTGQDLVDYVNIVQPFFKAKASTLTDEEKKVLIMDERFLRKPVDAVRIKKFDNNGSSIPESISAGLQFPFSLREVIDPCINPQYCEARSLFVSISPRPLYGFDARTKWPACNSIKNIRDQSACGERKKKLNLRPTQIFLLVVDSYVDQGLPRCNGGSPFWAWRWAKSVGICSGGAYGKKGVCKQYPFHPCGYHKDQPYYGRCPKSGFKTPVCMKNCQPGYLSAYQSDMIYVDKTYSISNKIEDIQNEIMTNGPVQATFTVYEDFYHYTTGVYVHTGGEKRGGHAVKIIGWGVEKGTPYWLISNSWSSDWGEGGLFRIVRGKDECSIESDIYAGLMKV